MRRVVVPFLALALAACAVGMGGPEDVPLSTVALRADRDATPAAAAAALTEVGAEVALVAGPGDASWFAAVAERADLHLSGPALSGGVGVALMAMEPLGDTVLDLRYEGGGTITLVDALYDLGEDHYLDLMAFRVDPGADLGALSTRMLRYIATDVPPSAAIILAVAVPSRAVGDSIATLLAPGYFDSLRCGNGGAGGVGGEIRLIYGPEARIWCGDVTPSTVAAGARIHAELVAGLRR